MTIDSFGLNSTSFCLHIESLVKQKRCTYLEAILMYCEETGMEFTSVGSLLSETMKEKLEVEAEELHLLKK